jgi:hypothetical protein
MHKSVSRQGQKNQLSLEMLEQGVIIALEKKRDSTNVHSHHGVKQNSLLGKTSQIIHHQKTRLSCYFGGKHVLLPFFWLTNAEEHIWWDYETISEDHR